MGMVRVNCTRLQWHEAVRILFEDAIMSNQRLEIDEKKGEEGETLALCQEKCTGR